MYLVHLIELFLAASLLLLVRVESYGANGKMVLREWKVLERKLNKQLEAHEFSHGLTDSNDLGSSC